MLSRFAFPVLLSVAGLLLFLLPFTATNNLDAAETSIKNYTGSNTLIYKSDQVLFDEYATITAEVSHRDNLFYLNLWVGGYENRITFVLREEVIKETAYELDHPSKRYLSFLYHGKDCIYSSDDYYTGMLMIHKYDTAQKIIAGSFEFMAYSTDCDELILVNNGTFDATYVSN
jgi:Family of unknown function (DUF6252)